MKVARRKLTMLDAASKLEDLRVPPANRLEALQGDQKGNTRSGRMTNGASVSLDRKRSADVEFTDYH